MKTGLTATLLVCVAAAGVAIGALAIDAGGDSDSASDADSTDESGGTGGSGGYGSDDSSSDAGEAADTATLTISDFNFSAVTAPPGATVEVDNRDGAPHTATAEDGSFDTGNIDANGSSSFVAPSEPGTYQIQCNIHPQMSGTVTVG